MTVNGLATPPRAAISFMCGGGLAWRMLRSSPAIGILFSVCCLRYWCPALLVVGVRTSSLRPLFLSGGGTPVTARLVLHYRFFKTQVTTRTIKRFSPIVFGCEDGPERVGSLASPSLPLVFVFLWEGCGTSSQGESVHGLTRGRNCQPLIYLNLFGILLGVPV